ncbi:MAG: DNA-binding protein [Bacteroidota bacterium]
MSVKYRAVAKGQPGVVGGGEIKYYAAIMRESKVNLRTMLGEISELTVAHPGMVLAVLEAFLYRVDNHLLNGRAVELGQLGSFYPSISSSPADTSEGVRKESIKRFKVIFRPSQLLKERLDRVKFIKESDDTPATAA